MHDSADIENAASSQPMKNDESRSRCEKLFERIIRAADGLPLQLSKLRGSGVPTDTDVFLCSRTLVALQVRVKALDQLDDVLHDYALDPEKVNAGKGGIYELQCLHSKHQLQVKVQPSLGLADLLAPYTEEPTAFDLTTVLDQQLWPFLGIYYILWACSSEPSRKSVPLATGYSDSTKHFDWILDYGGMSMIDKLCSKCNVFTRSYGQPPRLNLMEPDRPKTRGMLLKALLEVKMLMIRAVSQIRNFGERYLSDKQSADFEAFMIYVYEDCCAGGVQEQYMCEEESMQELRFLICGGVKPNNDSRPAEKGVSALNIGQQRGIVDLDRPQLVSLRAKLADVSQHLISGGDILDEANIATGNLFTREKDSIGDSLVQIQGRLEELEARLHTMEDDSAEGVGGAAKRQRRD